MSTGAIVIVVVVIVVVAALAVLAVDGRRRSLERRRLEAAEQRHEAEVRAAAALRWEADAAERAARARYDQALAHEQTVRARQDRELALARNEAAARIDPDVVPEDRDRRAADVGAPEQDTAQWAPSAQQDTARHAVAWRPVPGPAGMGYGGARREPGVTEGRHAAADGADPAGRTDDLHLGDRSTRRQDGTRMDEPVDPAARTDELLLPARPSDPPRAQDGHPTAEPGPAHAVTSQPGQDHRPADAAWAGHGVPAQRAASDQARRDAWVEPEPDQGRSGPARAIAERFIARSR